MNPTLLTSWNTIVEKINRRRQLLRFDRIPTFSASDHVTSERAASIQSQISELARYFLDPEIPFVLSYPDGLDHIDTGNNLSNTDFRTRTYSKNIHWPILSGLPLEQLGNFLDACNCALEDMHILGGLPWYDKICARDEAGWNTIYVPGITIRSYTKTVSGSYDWNMGLAWYNGTSSPFSALADAVSWIRSQSSTTTEVVESNGVKSYVSLWNLESYTNYVENSIDFFTHWFILEKDSFLPDFTATAYFTAIEGADTYTPVQFSNSSNTTIPMDATYSRNSDGSLNTSSAPTAWTITSHSLGAYSTGLSTVGSSDFVQEDSLQTTYNNNQNNQTSTKSGWHTSTPAIVFDFANFLSSEI